VLIRRTPALPLCLFALVLATYASRAQGQGLTLEGGVGFEIADGGGTVSLGNNSYEGDTTLSGGTLDVMGAGIVKADPGTIQIGSNDNWTVTASDEPAGSGLGTLHVTGVLDPGTSDTGPIEGLGAILTVGGGSILDDYIIGGTGLSLSKGGSGSLLLASSFATPTDDCETD
jgi:autotransporter-associated beta strand protein